MKTTIYKYIINEIWPTFLACLFVSTFIVMATEILSITDLVVGKGVPIPQVTRMVCYLLPDILLFALPAACLISVVLAFLRLTVDSEIIALKSSGVSLYQLIPPVALFSLLCLVGAMVVSLVSVPWGNSSFKKLLFEIAETKADLGIKERVFFEPFNDIVFYVNHYQEKTKEMEDVFVSDERDPSFNHTIIAEKGRVLYHPKEKVVTLLLQDGTIFVVDNNFQSGRTIKFKTYDLNINLTDVAKRIKETPKSPKEMTQAELIEQLRIIPNGETKHNEVMLELLEKYTIPLAVFLMGFVGMSLGAQLRGRGRSLGIGVSLSVFFIYYLCLAGARSICESGAVPPVIGVWVPDLFLFIVGVHLLQRVANEKPIVLMFNAN